MYATGHIFFEQGRFMEMSVDRIDMPGDVQRGIDQNQF